MRSSHLPCTNNNQTLNALYVGTNELRRMQIEDLLYTHSRGTIYYIEEISAPVQKKLDNSTSYILGKSQKLFLSCSNSE